VPDPLAGHSDQHRPLGAYGLLTAIFNIAVVALVVVAGRRGRLPQRYGAGDLVLVAAATAKLSRLVARDRVTSAIRAPFTRFEEDAGHGEVDEAARGRGLQRAIGELVVCPYCLAQWIAAALVAGLALAPRATRAVAAIFTVFGLSDLLQLGRSALEERAS
jgi:hypothetical protein